MKKNIVFVLVVTACLFLPRQASSGARMEFKQASRLIIENGHVYKLAPTLYAEVDIEKKKVTRTLYDLAEKEKGVVSRAVFEVVSRGDDRVSLTMPKWLKGIKKSLGHDLPRELEMVVGAVNTDRCVNFLSVGETFMIEVYSRVPYQELEYSNVLEYGYYKRVE